ILIGASPFLVSGGAIQPLDTQVTYVENLYRQAAGQYKSFDKASHRDSSFIPFGFKEYVRHKIPLKRVINGAYCCFMDPLGKIYYYTTLTLDPFYFKVLKNLLIYEIVSGKAAYLHTALNLYLSMCTCEEDFKLMIEYGVIQWDFPMEGYESFCEKIKELLDVMYCWKFLNTLTWHTEMVKIAYWKDKKGDTSNWNDFASTCYSNGLLKKELDSVLYKSLA
ncbi:3468_t:CDS:1, partial [Ambispora leptoticha]